MGVHVALALLLVWATIGSASAGRASVLASRKTGDWPQFRGPSGDGHSHSTGLPLTWSEQEHVTWKTGIPGEGWSSPVVEGDQIWMQTAHRQRNLVGRHPRLLQRPSPGLRPRTRLHLDRLWQTGALGYPARRLRRRHQNSRGLESP